MPRGGRHNILSVSAKKLKTKRIKGCLLLGLSIRQAVGLLTIHGRGYSIWSVQKEYKSISLVSFKPKTFKIKMAGLYDNNLQGYMEFFLRKKLHPKFSIKDLVQECNLAIITQKNLKQQLESYIKSNKVPSGRDLSLLKAVLYRQRLKFIEKETRHPTEQLNIEVCDIHSKGNDYDD